MTHQTNAPDLAFECAQPRADFNAVFIKQPAANDRVVRAIRNFHGVEHGEAMALLTGISNAHFRQTRTQQGRHFAVTVEGMGQAFFEQDIEGFVKAVKHVDRGGVVVGAFLAPVIFDHADIEIPALHLVLTGGEFFHRAGGEGDRRQARRAGEAFLRPGISGIDAPIVNLNRRATETRDAIEQEECAGGMGGLAYLIYGLMSAGRSFSMDEGDNSGLASPNGLDHFGLIEDGAPGGFDFLDDCAAATCDIGHAPAKDAVDTDKHFITRLDKICENRFHASGACAAHGHGHLIFGLEDFLELGTDLIHKLQKDGIKVPYGRAGEGFKHAGGSIGRARAQEDALGYFDHERMVNCGGRVVNRKIGDAGVLSVPMASTGAVASVQAFNRTARLCITSCLPQESKTVTRPSPGKTGKLCEWMRWKSAGTISIGGRIFG